MVTFTYCRYFAICHPVLFQSTRAYTNPWIDIGIAFISGMIIQVPYTFANQVADPSCWTPNLNETNTINLTVFCPCNNDENDVRPDCWPNCIIIGIRNNNIINIETTQISFV